MFHAKLAYDKNAVCQSRVCDDFERIVNVDEKGDEHITFQKVNYPKFQESLGSFNMWSIRSLIAAGIDPDTGIKTGFNTRLQGASAVQSAIERINGVVESENKKSE